MAETTREGMCIASDTTGGGSPKLQNGVFFLNTINRNDVAEFLVFAGLKDYAALRAVARSHVIAWRKDLETQTGAVQHPAQTLGAVLAL